MIIHLKTCGTLACFTRPEMKVERVSYSVMTPSAARGLLEAILYKPQFRWQIRRIAVCKPIRFLSFRRNEVKSRLSPRKPEPLFADEDRTQRNTLALRDVEYVIEAQLSLSAIAYLPGRTSNADEDRGEPSIIKYVEMFKRRAGKGQCFHQPCFGCREFPAFFELATEADMASGNGVNHDTDLGLMLYDTFNLDVVADELPGKAKANKALVTFFPARLRNGIVEIPPWSEIKKTVEGAL
jgi:CRISPR-associated protein Cas5d